MLGKFRMLNFDLNISIRHTNMILVSIGVPSVQAYKPSFAISVKPIQ